jgi:hypothetical protein
MAVQVRRSLYSKLISLGRAFGVALRPPHDNDTPADETSPILIFIAVAAVNMIELSRQKPQKPYPDVSCRDDRQRTG